jgi:P4 family phage/plasmid primase-like protien
MICQKAPTPWRALLEVLFEPEDLIEIRFLPPGDGRTSLFATGPDGIDVLESAIRRRNAEKDVYFGVNPRATEARGDDSVEVARVLWADFDGCDQEEAGARLAGSGLPWPTAMVCSGHGVHAYWRLAAPITPEQFHQLQDRLARLLHSDRKVKNPERIARLPGTRHVAKGDGAECVIIEVAGGVAELAEIEEVLPPPPAPPKPPAAPSPFAGPANGAPRLPIRRASEKVLQQGVGEGERDDSLFSLACDLAAAGVPEAGAERLVLEAAARCSPPFPEMEARAKVRSAYSKPRRPAPSVVRDARYLAPLTQSGGTDETEVDMAPLRRPVDAIRADLAQFTDVGAAARLTLRGALDWRWCAPLKTWYCWQGTHWSVDEACGVTRLGKETALGIIDEARDTEDEDRRAKLLSFAGRMQKRDRITAMIELAKPDLAVSPGDLDQDDWVLATRSGEIDLRTGELHPSRRSSLCTRVSPVEYDPRAKAPRWEQFLAEITAGDVEFMEFLERLFGMCLTGDVSDQVFPILKGTGRNGKSVLLDTVSWILGDFAIEAPPDLVVRRSQREHPAEIAAMRGRRLVVVSETEAEESIRVALIKRLTGNERLSGRGMHENWSNFRRTAKVVLVTNNTPRVDENTEAIRRRLLVVPFPVVIPEAKQDPGLLAALRDEAPGVLARLVRGCVEWQKSGLGRPTVVAEATSEMVGSLDPFSRWVDEACSLGPDAWTSSEAIATSITRWAAQRQLVVPQGKALAERLVTLGCARMKRCGVRGWLGIAVRGANVEAAA